MASKFTIFKGKNDEYYFNLKAANGEKILSSEGYTSKSGCENGIESVKKNAPDDARYERKESSNGKYYFVLKAANHEVLGTSELYESAQGRDKGIEAVKREAPGAEVEE